MDLLNFDEIFKNKIFRVPDYQRGYAWEIPQLKDFWEDLINLSKNRSHYSGVITITRADDVKDDRNQYWLTKFYDVYEVVDGQQRLTTFVIFIQAFIELYRNIEENKGKNDDSIYISDSIKLAEVIASYLYKVKPSGNQFRIYKLGYTEDNPCYEYIRHRIFGENGNGEVQESIYTSNLYIAKEFFDKQLSKYYLTHQTEGLDDIFIKITQSFLFNVYKIENEFDKLIAFETMNNRWRNLSNLELLKKD